MIRPSAPLKKLEKDVVRAAIRWSAAFIGRFDIGGHERLDKAQTKLAHICARLAQRKPSGK